MPGIVVVHLEAGEAFGGRLIGLRESNWREHEEGKQVKPPPETCSD
jgi:monoamine oxidase